MCTKSTSRYIELNLITLTNISYASTTIDSASMLLFEEIKVVCMVQLKSESNNPKFSLQHFCLRLTRAEMNILQNSCENDSAKI